MDKKQTALHPVSPGHLIPVNPSILACLCYKTVFLFLKGMKGLGECVGAVSDMSFAKDKISKAYWLLVKSADHAKYLMQTFKLTVRVSGVLLDTLIFADSAAHATALARKQFGASNVISSAIRVNHAICWIRSCAKTTHTRTRSYTHTAGTERSGCHRT